MFNLTEDQKALFKQIHDKHLACMGTDKRKNYVVSELKNVVWDEEEDCFKVYYKNGDWWHYTLNGEWY